MSRKYKWEKHLEEMTEYSPVEYAGNDSLREGMTLIIDRKEKAELDVRRRLSKDLAGYRKSSEEAAQQATKANNPKAKSPAIQTKDQELKEARVLINRIIDDWMTIGRGPGNAQRIDRALRKILKSVPLSKEKSLPKISSLPLLESQYTNFVEVLKKQEFYIYKYSINKGSKPENLIKRVLTWIDTFVVKVLNSFSLTIDKMPDQYRQMIRASIAYYYCLIIFVGFIFLSMHARFARLTNIPGWLDPNNLFGKIFLFVQAHYSKTTNSLYWPDVSSFQLVTLLLGLLAIFAWLLEKFRDDIAIGARRLRTLVRRRNFTGAIKWVQVRYLTIIGGVALLWLGQVLTKVDSYLYVAFILSILFSFFTLLIVFHPNNFLVGTRSFKTANILAGIFLSWEILVRDVTFTAKIPFSEISLALDHRLLALSVILIASLNLILIRIDTKTVYDKGKNAISPFYFLLGIGLLAFGVGVASALGFAQALNLESSVSFAPHAFATLVIIAFTLLSFLSFARLATVDFMRLFGVSFLILSIILIGGALIAWLVNGTSPQLNVAIEAFLFTPIVMSFLFGFVLFRREFVAGTSHLRFGWIISAAVNAWQEEIGTKNPKFRLMHPIFGALILRIGGGSGIGGTGLFSMHTLLFVSNGYVAYHAIAHDAGGYLQNSFGISPGYQYAPGEKPYVRIDRNVHYLPKNNEFINPGFSHALTGQISGFLLWANSVKELHHNHVSKVPIKRSP